MSHLIEQLRSFNRKERFILLTKALGTEVLGDAFRRELEATIEVTVPTDAFVAMDYHLDWLSMALYLADNAPPAEPIHNDDLVRGNQQDVDLLVAFDGDSTTHIVLIEAKVETDWTPSQLESKISRLRRIFGKGRPGARMARPHFVLTSPERPPHGISAASWPDWMKRDDELVWMGLNRPPGLKKTTRCTADRKASRSGHFVRLDPVDRNGP